MRNVLLLGKMLMNLGLLAVLYLLNFHRVQKARRRSVSTVRYEKPNFMEDGKRYLMKRMSKYFKMKPKAILKHNINFKKNTRTSEHIIFMLQLELYLRSTLFFTCYCFLLVHLQRKSRKKTIKCRNKELKFF